MGGLIRLKRNGRLDIVCLKDLDRQFVYLVGLSLFITLLVLLFALFT